jgi:hypothetical protein
MSKKQYYSDDERIIRVWDIETVKDLMSRRQVLQMNNERRKELDTLWVTEPKYRKTASIGSNWGYYVGMDEISNYYVVEYTKKQQEALDAKCAANPELRNIRDNFGYGDLIAHHISTPCVVLAGDGKTAKGVWYSLGVKSTGNPDGTCKAMWYPERVCADFVKEDSGEWKIWHVLISNDVEYEAGTNLGDIETFTGIPGEAQTEFGEPTLPYVVHNRDYGWSDDYPTVPPLAYYSYDPAEGYGPEGRPQWHKGHPNYRKEYQGK